MLISRFRLSTLLLLFSALVVWLAVAVAPAKGASAGSDAPWYSQNFSADELAWMKAKGVLRYTVDPRWAPLEYVENGKPQGLMVQYMNALAARLPMRVEFVPTTGWQDAIERFARGEIDLLPSSTLSEKDFALTGPLLQILPYYISATMVAAKTDHPIVLEVSNLAGLRIAVAAADDSDDALQEMVPSAKFRFYETPRLMLEALIHGEVDVAVGPELVLQPLMSRSYRGQLAQAGTLVELPVVQRMGVSADAAMLKSVIDKALLSLTALDTDNIMETWQATIDYGRPDLNVLWRHYKTEVALAVVLILFLTSTVMFALHLRRQTKRSAERKLRFLATVSHEIRNAMNAVVGPLDVLSHEPVAARRLEMIDTARDGARVLLETVNGLLDLSTLRARKARVQAHPADVGQVVEDVLRLMRPGVSAGITLVGEVRSDRWVTLDATKYRQVLMNLLSNAIKFTEQGTISVMVEVIRRGGSSLLSTQVCDSGAGIAPKQLKAIFDAYAQAHDETMLMQANIDSSRRGTGLGLMICSELVALQGGKLWAESTVGEGSTFYFELPVELGDVLPAQPVSAPASSASFDLPVLVVDDNPVNLMVLRKQLDVLGCQVTTCLSSREALQVWRQGQFGLVLLDCNMPDIDGYALARLIRSEESIHKRVRTPLVAVSARDDAAHVQRCQASGMDDVTVKPLQLEQLRRVLGRWLDRDRVLPSTVAPATARVALKPEAVASASASVAPKPEAVASEAITSKPGMPAADQAIAEVFVQTNHEDLAIIQSMLAARRAAEVSHRAHRVAGAAWVMQEQALAQAATALERLALEEPADWEAIATVCERVTEEMTEYARRHGL